MARILFIVRSEPDFERFCAIVPYLRAHECTMLDCGGVRQRPSLHLSLLEDEGVRLRDWTDALPSNANRNPEAILRAYAPSVLIIDQFGPECPREVKAFRDEAMRQKISCCMVPHGVPTLFRRGSVAVKRAQVPEATVICYANDVHRREASAYYAVPGSYQVTLGDPRFDVGHIGRLRSKAMDFLPDVSDTAALCRIAFFESHFSQEFSQECLRAGSGDPEAVQWSVVESLAAASSSLLVRRHPRSARARFAMHLAETNWESISLSNWADIVVSGASTIICEAVVLEKRCWILDLERLTPSHHSIFTAFSTPLQTPVNTPPLREITAGRRLLTQCCWGGGDGRVAQRYANLFERVAVGDYRDVDLMGTSQD